MPKSEQSKKSGVFFNEFPLFSISAGYHPYCTEKQKLKTPRKENKPPCLLLITASVSVNYNLCCG